MSWVHKIRLHDRRGKGTAESFSREEIKASTAEGRWSSSGVTSACCASTYYTERCSLTFSTHGMTTYTHLSAVFKEKPK